MNKVELIGRLTAEPELRYTESEKAYTRFTLAVNRKYKKDSSGNYPIWETLYCHIKNRACAVNTSSVFLCNFIYDSAA